jgi:hypothetical protein
LIVIEVTSVSYNVIKSNFISNSNELLKLLERKKKEALCIFILFFIKVGN